MTAADVYLEDVRIQFRKLKALAEDAVRHLASVLVAIRDGQAIDPSGGRIAARLRDESSSFGAQT